MLDLVVFYSLREKMLYQKSLRGHPQRTSAPEGGGGGVSQKRTHADAGGRGVCGKKRTSSNSNFGNFYRNFRRLNSVLCA